MTTPSTGVIQRLAARKAAAWATALAVGAGHEVSFLSGQAKRSASVEVDNSRGLAFSKDGTPGPVAVAPSYNHNLRYEGLDLFIACLMGIAGAPAQQGATIAYKNIYKWNTDVYGIFATIAKLMGGTGTYVEEVPSAKISGITISGEVGAKPLQIAIETIGINKETGSAVNTLATFASVTMPSGADVNPVMFSHLVFRMNDQSGAALASPTDVINPSKFTLSLKRKLKGEYTGAYRTTGTNIQDLIDEPTNDGFPELKLTLEFPTHTAATYLTALGSDTRKKIDITATGALIATPYSYQHLWQFPHLQLITADPTDDNGRIKQPLEFLIHGASAAPTGMTGITDPLWWTVINKRTTDPLA